MEWEAHTAVVLMIEGDDGERRGVRLVSPRPLVDPTDETFSLLCVEWWGGPDDGDHGYVRLPTEDAVVVGNLYSRASNDDP